MHFKIKGPGKIIDELEKNEAIDKNLLRYMTVKVKKFNLEAKYFSKKDEYEKKEYKKEYNSCLLYTSPSPRDAHESRMPSSA